MKTQYGKTYKYAADFETTVYEDQETTEVWSAAFIELYTETPIVMHSIEDFFNFFFQCGRNVTIYFHNLKFDGSFILDYLKRNKQYKEAIIKNKDETRWVPYKYIKKGQYQYSISSKGQWYKIFIKSKYGNNITILDSLKLMPFSLDEIGKCFNTKHRKSSMKYEGKRFAGCEITDEEMSYIENDVFVLKEALEYMFSEGHNKMTIGACCMSEYKEMLGRDDFDMFFPNIYNNDIDLGYGYPTEGDYVRSSYRGAWTYLAKGKENKVFHNGLTLDVNSLYPSMMHSISGNRYPVGKGCFWEGNYIPEKCSTPNIVYFIRIKTSFMLKEGMLPTIQMKGDWRYKPTEFLERSALYYDGEYHEYEFDGQRYIPITVVMTLTMMDYELIQKHYDLYNFEILSGVYYYSEVGLFDGYIDKYMEIKANNKGAKRTEAKLFLNNLYGKFASSPDSSFKVAYLDEDKLQFETILESEKEPGYIPVGSFVTSYARRFTIEHAQANYYGKDKPGFIYADTDSIHCDLNETDLNNIIIHDSALCCWKMESRWDYAIFVRPKTYIEHLEIEDGYIYQITCAGMPNRCKEYLMASMEGTADKLRNEVENFPESFFYDKDNNPIIRTIEDFKAGLKVPGKLVPKRIHGGIVLKEIDYRILG